MSPSRRRALLAMLSPLLMTGLLACSTTSSLTQTAATDSGASAAVSPAKPDVCLVWKIVRYSKTDTTVTIEQVRQNNAARRAMCGG